MADLPISQELAEQLYEIARQEHRSVEELLASMLTQYKVSEPQTHGGPSDEDIDVPDDIQDKEAYRTAIRQMRPKLYEIARRYWRSVGDQERLALTDEQLDQQFWLIDADGVPRLKSEKGSVTLPPDPLEALIGLIDDAPVDLSTSVREAMALWASGRNI
jgi:hypothetical protein